MSEEMMRMQSVAAAPQAGNGPAAAVTIGSAELERWLGWAYPRLLGGADREELLSELCNRIAEHLQMPLVVISQAAAGGTFVNLAQSRQNALWADLQKMAPRWDDSFAGNGPAARAVRSGSPTLMAASDEGMALWRQALERQRVSQVLAWPLKTAGATWVLEFYARAGQLQLDADLRPDLQRLSMALVRLMDDIDRCRHQEMLAESLESAGNAMFVTDLNGTIVWCNRAFTTLTGYAREEAVGRNPRFLKSGQQSLRYYRDLWSVIRSGQVWTGETVDRDRNGRSYTIRQTISPVAHAGRVTHYLCVQNDISRQKQHEDELARGCRVDPGSGLLTRAAFEAEAEAALSTAAAQGQRLALALITLPGVRRELESMEPAAAALLLGGLAARVREHDRGHVLACASDTAEFTLLLPEPAAGQSDWLIQLEQLMESLRQPLPAVAEAVNEEIKPALVRFPADAETLTGLRLAAERRLADEPMRPARRQLTH